MDQQIDKVNTTIQGEQELKKCCFFSKSKTQDVSILPANSSDKKWQTENIFNLDQDESDLTFTQ